MTRFRFVRPEDTLTLLVSELTRVGCGCLERIVRNLLIFVGVFAGTVSTAQMVVNARLGVALGSPFLAAATSFSVGVVCTWLAVLAAGAELPTIAASRTVPWWAWLGGLLSATFIIVSIMVARPLGAALLIGSVVVGQLLAGVLIDHYGWFGMPVQPVTFGRLLGALFLVAGVVLIR
jgi:transporter family-2 protein